MVFELVAGTLLIVSVPVIVFVNFLTSDPNFEEDEDDIELIWSDDGH